MTKGHLARGRFEKGHGSRGMYKAKSHGQLIC